MGRSRRASGTETTASVGAERWGVALDPRRPRELMAAGWSNGYDAECWAKAFGRLPDRGECGPLLAADIDGRQASSGPERLTHRPTSTPFRGSSAPAGPVLRRAGVVGIRRNPLTPLSPAGLRPWREAGVESANDATNWRWALLDTVSPEAIRRLGDAGVIDGVDACSGEGRSAGFPLPSGSAR